MNHADSDCLFCRIARGELPSQRLYEDEDVIAFRDIAPVAPTHVLVIPRRHVADADALSTDDGPLLARLFTAVRSVAEAEGLRSGYRIVTNIGEDGGQSVDHLHLHVLGGRAMSWPPG